MQPIRLLVIAGSSRTGSLNRGLAAVAGRMATDAGALVDDLDLRALQLPVYDADLEAAEGVPEGAERLRAALVAADGLLLVTPEYNGFPTPLVINAFDWMSRVKKTETHAGGLASTTNKAVGLLSASPTALGGIRALNTLRQYLQMSFAMVPAPKQFALSHADKAFDANSQLKDEAARQSVQGVVAGLLKLAGALRSVEATQGVVAAA